MNRITTFSFRSAIWVGLFTLLGTAGIAQTGAAEKPNVLFILVDDLGMMDLEAYNPDTFYDSPHIARLADSALKFNAGYDSNPVCSPTRFSILTGRYPTRRNATDWFGASRAARFLPAEMNHFMPLDETTIAEAMREGGYTTFFAGKWHLGTEPELWPENQGFDINRGGWRAGSPRAYGGGGYFSPYNNPRLEDGPEGEYLTDRLAQETIQFLQNRGDKPFFAYLSFYQVHTPLEAPEELVEKYRQRARERGLDEQEAFGEEEQVWPVDAPRKVRILQSHPVYAAMVESMDRAVGQVLDELEALGLAENTVVIFTSDDGGLATAEGHPTSNLPLRGGKGWLYEGGLRAPLLIRWPGVTPGGTTTDLPVMNTDFYPTLLEMAGLPKKPEQHLDGVSLVPLIRDQIAPDRDALFWHYPHYANQGGFPGGAIRMGSWKLIERYEDGRVHLYHVVDDLEEQHDLAAEHPERVRQMRERLHQWYEEVGAKFLRPRPDGPQPWRPVGP